MISTFLFLLATAEIAPSPYARIEPDFTSELICSIQHQIRFQEKAWEPWFCLRVHAAFTKAAAETKQPIRTLFAIAINESDLRLGAKRSTYPMKFSRAADGTPLVEDKWVGSVHDGGLMGVRCRIGKDGLCSNDLIKGWKMLQVFALENNIMLGAKILATKKSLQHYNGGTKEHGYQARIDAILAAMAGAEVKISGKRMKKLVKQIVNGVSTLVS
jgi:hypothetical protein